MCLGEQRNASWECTKSCGRVQIHGRKSPRFRHSERSEERKAGLRLSTRDQWLRRKEGLGVNRKRVLPVMRERSLLVRSRRLRARRKKEWGRVEAARPNQIWQSDMTKIWAGPAVGWAYLVSVRAAEQGEQQERLSKQTKIVPEVGIEPRPSIENAAIGYAAENQAARVATRPSGNHAPPLRA
jgi:hypothetical protein